MAVEQDAGPRRAVPSYDDFSRRLVQLSADQNGDGRIDQWTYLDGNRPLRGEADIDADGRIDRWEYFDAQAALVLVGTSSRSDGVEDTWTASGADGVGRNARLDCATARSAARSARVPSVASNWCAPKKTPMPTGGSTSGNAMRARSLREASFDTSFVRGRPDRRVVYDAKGRSVVEADPDGDGKFVQRARRGSAVGAYSWSVEMTCRQIGSFDRVGRPFWSWVSCGPAWRSGAIQRRRRVR